MAMMQVVNNQPSRPLSDVERLTIELNRIKKFLKDINSQKASDSTYESLLYSLYLVNDIICSADNSNDFFKIGGFDLLLPLLSVSHHQVKATTSEIIADLVQNNKFCQSKVLETNLAAELLKLVKEDLDNTVCTKAMYALSCLCRHNHEAVQHLEKLEALPVLLEAIQRPVEKLRTKAAFLLTHLCMQEPLIRDTLHEIGFVQKLVALIKEEQDPSHEHLLSALLALIEHHNPSKEECSKQQSFKETLESKLKFYDGKEEHDESREYCVQILKLCFQK